MNGGSGSGKTQKVTFKVEMPVEAASRAIADGVEVGQANMANKLAWALYESTKTDGSPVATNIATKDPSSKEFTVDIDMVKGLEYKVLFLAYCDGGTIFDVTPGDDLKSLNYNPSLVSNQEAYDAFVACHTHTVNNDAVTEVTLTRPFAQINAATTNADLTRAANLQATVTHSSLTINVPTQYNVLTGEASVPQDVTYGFGAILKDYSTQKNEILTVDGTPYNYLNMVYVLADANSSTHNATFTFYRNSEESDVIRTIEIANLPIKRNYRTNVIGDLITQTESFKIVIDDRFDVPASIVPVKEVEVASAQDIVAAIADANETKLPTTIKPTGNIVLGSSSRTASDHITIDKGAYVVLDLNGFTISGTDNTEKNFGLIQNNGKLTITDSSNEKAGKLILSANINNEWNRYSAVISNNPGATLVVEAGHIEHMGGTDMAYGIDNLTNGNIGDVNATINGGTIKSTYRAIRQFLNSDSKENNLTINGGFIEGGNNGIFFHDPSTKANKGELIIAEAASVNGVYLFVTEGSTEWPVNVSIAASAIGEKEVSWKNVPIGYSVAENEGIYSVMSIGLSYDSTKKTYTVNDANGLIALSNNGLKAGEKVILGADIDLAGKEFNGLDTFHPENNNVFDGQGYTVSNWTNKSGKSDMGFIRNWVGSITNVNFENCHLKTSGRSAIVGAKVYGNIENVNVKNCTIEDSYWACGIIAGLYNAGNISGCTVTGSSVKSNGGTGGIVGVINESAGTRSIYNCSVKNTTVNNTGAYGETYSGAFICGMINISNSTVEFKGCTYENNTKEGKYVGDLYYSADEDITVVVE